MIYLTGLFFGGLAFSYLLFVYMGGHPYAQAALAYMVVIVIIYNIVHGK